MMWLRSQTKIIYLHSWTEKSILDVKFYAWLISGFSDKTSMLVNTVIASFKKVLRYF